MSCRKTCFHFKVLLQSGGGAEERSCSRPLEGSTQSHRRHHASISGKATAFRRKSYVFLLGRWRLFRFFPFVRFTLATVKSGGVSVLVSNSVVSQLVSVSVSVSARPPANQANAVIYDGCHQQEQKGGGGGEAPHPRGRTSIHHTSLTRILSFLGLIWAPLTGSDASPDAGAAGRTDDDPLLTSLRSSPEPLFLQFKGNLWRVRVRRWRNRFVFDGFQSCGGVGGLGGGMDFSVASVWQPGGDGERTRPEMSNQSQSR